MTSTENSVHSLEPLKICKNLLKQKTEGIFCDIKLCLQGSVIWGHACVLAPLSAYIMEHFGSNSPTSHWCPKKPLVIDLDIAITAGQDKCALCLSTLVDFMYSQDLVILDGHFQHFRKMVDYLKIVDLFPIFGMFLYDGNLRSLSKEHSVQDLPVDSASDNDLLKVNQNEQSKQLVVPITKINHIKNSLLSTSSETKNSYQEQSYQKKQLNSSHDLNQSCNDNTLSLPSSSENPCTSVSLTLHNFKANESTDVFVEEHNYGRKEVDSLKQKCEFLCCNGEVSHNPPVNHRRKISCGMCSFTAVSVKKFLTHIESASHLGTMCPICTQKFQSTDSLQQHLKDHNSSKPYLCQFCSKRTRFWDFYKMHLKVHCRSKQFYCEICQRSFTSQQNLKVHLKNHEINYLCSSCKYLTSDSDAFKAHLLIHEEKSPSLTIDVDNTYDSFKCISDKDLIKHKTATRFLCNSCGKGFTQRSNLKRHVELKHFDVPNLHCFKCNYITKRTDLLKSHMKRHHNCVPEEVNGTLLRVTKIQSKKEKLDRNQSEVVGVLIPVQLTSTNDSSTLNVFAVKKCLSGESESLGDSSIKKMKLDKNDSSSRTNISSKSVLKKHTSSVENENSFAENCHVESSLETLHPTPCLVNYKYVKDDSDSLRRNNEEKVINIDSTATDLQLNISAGNPPCNENIDIGTNIDFWLNEATGEFLNGNSLVNVQVIDTSRRYKTGSSLADNAHEDTVDPLHTLILSDTSKTVSILDFREDVDEFKSNPQTPQTNLVEVDDPENLFPWSRIDTSFCSTWVLNEATGELNMVSFNVQPVKHSDESNLDENTGIFSPKDDDETALFLNEGTGDLSVIYFNPSKRESDSSKELYNGQGMQDVPDNVSEHSNDEDDFLNAEFFKATASFMAHKENEPFLNELTGEFDTTISDFNNYHPDLLENQISGSETYLNEETGEILWNVLNKNICSDFFTNSESFKYDLDDSLNCDDFEPFAGGINDFSSQFCLETRQDWQSFDETCDILLNECTGELMKKS